MNVALYSVEVSTRKRCPVWVLDLLGKKTLPIRQQVADSLRADAGATADYQKAAQKAWERLNYPELKVVRPPTLVLGHFTKKNVQVFVFEQSQEELTSKAEVTLNVIAISAVGIEQMFDVSLSKLKQVFRKGNVELLTDSHLLVFPFNSKDGDIYGQNLKIRASFEKRPFLEPREWIKLAFVFFLTVVSIILSQRASSADARELDFIWGVLPLDEELFSKSLLTACIFYLILDLIPLRIVPRFFEKGGVQIKIRDLSSVLETKERSLVASAIEDAKPAALAPPALPPPVEAAK